MTHALVTGGAGFIGSHLVERLLASGRQVTVVDDESTGCRQNLVAVLDHRQLRYRCGSAEDAALVAPLVADADEIYHLAAAVGVDFVAQHPIEAIRRNVEPTRLLLELAAASPGPRKRFFLASSSEVYGKNPRALWHEQDDLVLGPPTAARWSYGVAKALDEFLALGYARQGALDVVVGRFFNVVGRRQTGRYGMVLPRLVAAAVAGRPLVVHGDGQQLRCFAAVVEVVEAVIRLVAECPAAQGQIVNIGSDCPISIQALAETVRRLVPDCASTIEFQSYQQAFGPDFEDVRRRVPDLTRLRTFLGDVPCQDLETIIRDVWLDFTNRSECNNS